MAGVCAYQPNRLYGLRSAVSTPCVACESCTGTSPSCMAARPFRRIERYLTHQHTHAHARTQLLSGNFAAKYKCAHHQGRPARRITTTATRRSRVIDRQRAQRECVWLFIERYVDVDNICRQRKHISYNAGHSQQTNDARSASPSFDQQMQHPFPRNICRHTFGFIESRVHGQLDRMLL